MDDLRGLVIHWSAASRKCRVTIARGSDLSSDEWEIEVPEGASWADAIALAVSGLRKDNDVWTARPKH